MFKTIQGYNLEFATFGSGRGTVTVFRDPAVSPATPWQATHEGSILIVGGEATIYQMRKMWAENSRPRIVNLTGIANSTHQKIRDWLDSTTQPKR